jgi:hypothetical protein
LAFNLFLGLGFAALLAAAPAFSAGPSIGVASALGSYSVDDLAVTGNTDIFNATELRTTISPSDVHFANGAEVRFATRSEGTLFSDHLELKEGAVRLSHFDWYPVHVGQLQIEPDTFGAEAIIRTKGRTVEIASLGGAIKVANGGAMLTQVLTGTKLSFQNTAAQAQSGASSGATPQQTPAQTGANPAPKRGPLSDKKAILWAAGICAVGALVVGLIAASEGKSPF